MTRFCYSRQRDREPTFDTRETWDCSLSLSENTRKETIEMEDSAFQAQLNFGNVFKNCEHSLVKTSCPCPSRQRFIVCSKCCTVFCGEPCAGGPVSVDLNSSGQAKPAQRQGHQYVGKRPGGDERGVVRQSVYQDMTRDRDMPDNRLPPQSASLGRHAPANGNYGSQGQLKQTGYQQRSNVGPQSPPFTPLPTAGGPNVVSPNTAAAMSLLGPPPAHLPRLPLSPNRDGARLPNGHHFQAKPANSYNRVGHRTKILPSNPYQYQ